MRGCKTEGNRQHAADPGGSPTLGDDRRQPESRSRRDAGDEAADDRDGELDIGYIAFGGASSDVVIGKARC